MYVDVVPNRKSPPAILLRESYREDGKVKKRTIANITHWPKEQIESLKMLLSGKKMVPLDEAFTIERSLPHGHVAAVLGTIRKLGLDRIISAKPCRESELVLAMIVEQLIDQPSKLGMTRLWIDSTLADELGLSDADEDDLYAAMDWLVKRQSRIEKKLAGLHLTEGCTVLYDVSSSYYEGSTCPLARFGNSRDKKKGKPIIVYGVVADIEGRPVSVEVYPGNTGDPTTLPEQVDKLKERFELERVVIAGDRGMLTQTQIDELKKHPQLGWLSALRSEAIKGLISKGAFQPSLFDEYNLAEIASEDFPGERLMVCRNPLLAERRRHKRDELLAATESELVRIQKEIARRTKKLMGAVEIASKVEKSISRYKMSKHFDILISRSLLIFRRKEDSIAEEAALDGIYVIRTSEPEERISAEDAVRSYKSLCRVENLFRTLKGIDIKVRPIRHREEMRVRAHIFICMLAYYVEHHMRKALAPLLFDDEEVGKLRKTRDPVAPAEPSISAKAKKKTKKTADGFPVHSFGTLLDHLATQCKNTCRMPGLPGSPTINQTTEKTPLQQKTFTLLNL